MSRDRATACQPGQNSETLPQKKKRTKSRIPFDPAIPLLGIYQEKKRRNCLGKSTEGYPQFRRSGLMGLSLLFIKPPRAQGHFKSWVQTCQLLSRHWVAHSVLSLWDQYPIKKQLSKGPQENTHTHTHTHTHTRHWTTN